MVGFWKIWESRPIGFANGLFIQCERRKRIKDDSRVCGLAIYGEGKDYGSNKFGTEAKTGSSI